MIFLEEEPEELERWVPSADQPELDISNRGLTLTTTHEGFIGKTYLDPVGLCTIGFGHLIKKARCDGSEPSEFRKGITRLRGTQLLRQDMKMAEDAVMALVKTKITQGQFDALCDFVYNAGRGNFKKSSILKAINTRRLEEVPDQFRRWTKAGGKTLPGLVARREAEIELFIEGMSISRRVAPEGEELPEIDLEVGEQ